VHANSQTANFRISKPLFEKYGTSALMHRLNGILTDDVIVKRVARTDDKFHSRYSAKSRVYRYFMTTRKHAINREKLYYVKTGIDIDLAKVFCRFIEGVHSFKSLCKNKSDEHGFLSHVYSARVVNMNEGTIRFEICANRFLHSMVRAIVGAMIKVASGNLSMKEFKEKFKKGEDMRIQYVPANALFLYKVNY
jgi:tRNA pseudouridine38-40 synthase